MQTENVIWACCSAVAIALLLTTSSCVVKVSTLQRDCLAGAKTDAQAFLCLKVGG